MITKESPRNADDWQTLGYIREYLDTNRFSLEEPYMGTGFVQTRMLFSSSWMLMQATLSELSDIDPVEIVRNYLPPLLMILIVLSSYSFARAFFDDVNYALITAILQIIFFLSYELLGNMDQIFIRVAQDKIVSSMIILPMASLVAWMYLRTSKKIYFILLIALGLSMFLIHPLSVLLFILSWGSFSIISIFFNRNLHERRAILHLLSFVVFCTFIAIIMTWYQQASTPQWFSGSEINTLTMSRLENLHRINILFRNNIYIADPELVLHPFGVLTCLVAFALLWKVRQCMQALFIVSNVGIVLLMIYNPVVTPLFGRILSPIMISRISWLMPMAISVAILIDWISNKIISLTEKKLFTSSYIFHAIPVVFIIMSFILLQDNILKLNNERVERIQNQTWRTVFVDEQSKEVLIYLKKIIGQQEKNIILADRYFNHLIPAYIGNANVVAFRIIASNFPGRDRDAPYIFHQQNLNEEAAIIIQKYNVDYIVIDSDLPVNSDLIQIPNIVTLVFKNDTYNVYRLASDITSSPAGLHVTFGSIYFLQNRDDMAISEFKKALELDPSMSAAFVGLGDISQRNGELLTAEQYYQKAVEVNPNEVQAYRGLGEVFRKQRKFEKALFNYQQAINLDSNQKIFLQGFFNTLGDIYQTEGKMKEAKFAYQKALTYGNITHDQFIETEYLEKKSISYNFNDYFNIVFEGLSNHDLIHNGVFLINRDPRIVLFQHPNSKICFVVQVPPSSHLKFGIALSPEVWQIGKGDGVHFLINLEDKDSNQNIFSKYIDPKNNPSDRRWHDSIIDLSQWAGQFVTMTLTTNSGPNDDDQFDWAGWGDQQIVLPVYYDFLANLSTSDRSSLDSNQIKSEILEIDHETRNILFQHPPTRVSYHLDVPDKAELHFGVGMDPTVWSPEMGDGVEYRIYVRRLEEPNVLHLIYNRYLNPKHNPSDRHWIDEIIDLQAYSGEEVDIIFEASSGPEGDSNFDWGGWSNPNLVIGETRLLPCNMTK